MITVSSPAITITMITLIVMIITRSSTCGRCVWRKSCLVRQAKPAMLHMNAYCACIDCASVLTVNAGEIVLLEAGRVMLPSKDTLFC